jgi:hypothetical protein
MTTAPDYPTTVPDFLARIDSGWQALMSHIGRLDPVQLDGPQSADGWTVKDHLGHVAAWEATVPALLNGQMHFVGLDVPEEVYDAGGIDAVNAHVQARVAAQDVVAVLENLVIGHGAVLARLERLTDADLVKPYHAFVPQAPWPDDGTPVIAWLAGNTYEHYAEHIPWLDAIVAGVGG